MCRETRDIIFLNVPMFYCRLLDNFIHFHFCSRLNFTSPRWRVLQSTDVHSSHCRYTRWRLMDPLSNLSFIHEHLIKLHRRCIRPRNLPEAYASFCPILDGCLVLPPLFRPPFSTRFYHGPEHAASVFLSSRDLLVYSVVQYNSYSLVAARCSSCEEK